MKLISQINKGFKQEIRTIRQEMDQERERFEKSFQNFEEVKKQLNEKIEFERKHFRDQKKLLESAIDDAKLAISGNSEEFTNIQKKLRQENLELSRQIAEINSKPPPMHVIQPDITGIKEYLQEIVKESQQAKQDKAISELKLEHEMKITSKK